jgi:hypothetical protein
VLTTPVLASSIVENNPTATNPKTKRRSMHVS